VPIDIGNTVRRGIIRYRASGLAEVPESEHDTDRRAGREPERLHRRHPSGRLPVPVQRRGFRVGPAGRGQSRRGCRHHRRDRRRAGRGRVWCRCRRPALATRTEPAHSCPMRAGAPATAPRAQSTPVGELAERDAAGSVPPARNRGCCRRQEVAVHDSTVCQPTPMALEPSQSAMKVPMDPVGYSQNVSVSSFRYPMARYPIRRLSNIFASIGTLPSTQSTILTSRAPGCTRCRRPEYCTSVLFQTTGRARSRGSRRASSNPSPMYLPGRHGQPCFFAPAGTARARGRTDLT